MTPQAESHCLLATSARIKAGNLLRAMLPPVVVNLKLGTVVKNPVQPGPARPPCTTKLQQNKETSLQMAKTERLWERPEKEVELRITARTDSQGIRSLH